VIFGKMTLKPSVKEYLINKIRREGSVHLSLLDPEDIPLNRLPKIISDLQEAGSDGIMVGGSTLVDQEYMRSFISSIKENTNLPVIIFPNNITSVVPNADAIWFMSLLNSTNPYYITGAQMLAAPLVKKYNLEAISLAYLIIGEGKAVAFIGDAKPIPFDKPEIVAAYALAAYYLGMHFVYLEAGSGASQHVPPEMVSIVKRIAPKVMLIVGGGIRDAKTASKLVMAGADIIVTGTIVESDANRLTSLKEIVKSVKEAGMRKIKC